MYNKDVTNLQLHALGRMLSARYVSAVLRMHHNFSFVLYVKNRNAVTYILEEKLFFHLIFKSVFLQKKVTKDLNFSCIWIYVK